jgi:hypothetical protein
MMETKSLLAVALLAIGTPSFAVAQGGLPGDWEQKVATVVKEPERARRVTEAGRQYVEKRQASLDVMKAAQAEVKAAFRSQASSVGDRQLSLSLLRDDRRKAALAAVDSLLAVRALVSKKEWKEIWPEGFFALAGPAPFQAGQVQKALPSVMTDPVRLKQADGVAATLVASVQRDESARKKAAGGYSKLLERFESERDDFIDLVNGLEETQAKADNAIVGAAGELQRILTPDEWTSLVRVVVAAP